MAPEFLKFEDFKRHIAIVNKLVDLKIAKLKVSAHGLVSIQLDEQSFDKVELIKSTEKAKVKRLLATEIPVVISAALQEKPDSFLKSFLPGDSYSKNKPIREEFANKIKYVKDHFLTAPLRQRATLRAISKSDSLSSLKWDIGMKCHDYEKGKIERFPFATIGFQVNPTVESSLGFFVATALSKEQKEFTVDMHVDDIKELIDDLRLIADNLERIQKQEMP